MKNNEIREQLIHARDEYIEKIKSELMGPGSELSVPDAEHELISSSPLSRYSIGILFPQGNLIEQDNDETVPLDDEASVLSDESDETAEHEQTEKNEHGSLADETADETLDEEIGLATQYKPSSMGITFFVNGNPDIIHCKVSFATYRNALLNDCVIPYEPDDL